jgi:hypothetical protein
MSLADRHIDKLTRENEELKKEIEVLNIRIDACERTQMIIDRVDNSIRTSLIAKNFNTVEIERLVSTIPNDVIIDPMDRCDFRTFTEITLYRLLLGQDPAVVVRQGKDENGNWLEPSIYDKYGLEAGKWISENTPWFVCEELEYKDGMRHFIFKPTDVPVPLINFENTQLDD